VKGKRAKNGAFLRKNGTQWDFLELDTAEGRCMCFTRNKTGPTFVACAKKTHSSLKLLKIGVGPSADCFVDQWKKAFIDPTTDTS